MIVLIREVDRWGNVRYWDKRKLHRLDGPAYEGVDGTRGWYCRGVRSRRSGPAMVEDCGTIKWYVNGMIHRDGGYAIVEANGTLSTWWWNDMRSIQGVG